MYIPSHVSYFWEEECIIPNSEIEIIAVRQVSFFERQGEWHYWEYYSKFQDGVADLSPTKFEMYLNVSANE